MITTKSVGSDNNRDEIATARRCPNCHRISEVAVR